MKAPKEVFHKLQFFVELLHGGVCGGEFVEQSQTLSIYSPRIGFRSRFGQGLGQTLGI